MAYKDNYPGIYTDFCNDSFDYFYPESNDKSAKKPYEEVNIDGEVTAYYWYYGDAVNLEFDILGELTVASDAKIFYASGQVPDINTVGYIGQKYYNLIDRNSWTCVAIRTVDGKNSYYWEIDSTFYYPAGDGESVYIDARDYLVDKDLKLTFFNNKLEEIYSSTIPAQTNVTFSISSSMSKEFEQGTYYCSLTLLDPISGDKETLLSADDLCLLVK